MNAQLFRIALINILSLLYLGFVVSFMFGLAEHVTVAKIVTATLRRWAKLTGALVVLAVIVHLISNL